MAPPDDAWERQDDGRPHRYERGKFGPSHGGPPTAERNDERWPRQSAPLYGVGLPWYPSSGWPPPRGMAGQGGHDHGSTAAKGYQRSDARIREEIYEHLAHHPSVDATDIQVTVDGGQVTLSGWVDDRDEKWLAEDLAAAVGGVRDVYNRLRVWPAGPAPSGGAGRGQPATGMAVLGSDGLSVGRVDAVKPRDLCVRRTRGRYLRVPREAIQTIRQGQVVLNVPTDQVEAQGWESGELTGSLPA